MTKPIKRCDVCGARATKFSTATPTRITYLCDNVVCAVVKPDWSVVFSTVGTTEIARTTEIVGIAETLGKPKEPNNVENHQLL